MKNNTVLVEYKTQQTKGTIELTRVPCNGESILLPNNIGSRIVCGVTHLPFEESKPVARITFG